jgi:hypothetical protein
MSILQELLNLGLVDIGSDDSRFDKMQLASSALSDRFKDDPSLLIQATLISIDEDIDEDDPMFALVEELVLVEWKTLRNTHVNRPRELLRSIIIDALTATVNRDNESAGIVWNSAVSALRHRQVRLGKAASVIENLLINARDLAEKEAVLRAGIVASVLKKRSKKKSSTPKKVTLKISAAISDDDVFADVARSAGPQHPQKENLESPNPHWPNSHQAWAHEFATRMATALSKAVNLGSARISKDLSEQLPLYLGEFEKQLTGQFRDVEQLQSDMLQMHESNRMRLNVLWWSEALYSPVLQAGYRELGLPVAAVAAAVDLANIVPPLAPASVCYVLGETLHRLSQLKAGANEMAVQAYIECIVEAKVKFGDHLPVAPTNNSLWPLVDLVGESVAGSCVSPEAIRKRSGIDPTLVLSPAEFAMWVFRGIQANRLVEALR